MFFSDGGTEWPGSVIDKYKNETLTEVSRAPQEGCGQRCLGRVTRGTGDNRHN